MRQFRIENPGVGEFKATCHDGSTVIIRLRDKTAKPRRAPQPGDTKIVRGVKLVARAEMADLGGGEYAERVHRGKTCVDWVTEDEDARATAARRLFIKWKDVPVGTAIKVRLDGGDERTSRTRSAPWILGGFYGTPVISLEGFSGGYRLDRVTRIESS